MNIDQTVVRHDLPDDEPGSGDTDWFYRQTPFEREEIKHLVSYKRNILGIREDGRYPKKPTLTYPHILPDGYKTAAFCPNIADQIIAHLKEEGIQEHTELLNLKSSQAACLNFLFPLRLNKSLAARVLHKHLPGLDVITDIQFEYTGQDEAPGARLECTEWLGEPPNGKRGQYRTSIDAAIFWSDTLSRAHITLVEWKYTERSFGSCSAFANANALEQSACKSSTYKDTCLLVNHGPRRNRRYWDHLDASGIKLEKMKVLTGCPFRGPFYQLMRQFLVAQYLRNKHPQTIVDVLAIHFAKNKALNDVPKELKPLCRPDQSTVISAWNSTLTDVPELRSLHIEDIMAEFDAATETDTEWRSFIRQRYRV